jgi:cell division protein FtsB
MSYASDALIDAQGREIEKLEAENERLDAENASLRGAVQGLGELRDKYKAENAKLRDERVRYEDLARILDREWGIEVSWDGLRKLWYVGLTEAGVKEVDALKAKNAFLRACLGNGCADCAVGMGEYADSLCDPLKAENADLRKRISQLEYERMMMFLELAGEWIRVKQREMEVE